MTRHLVVVGARFSEPSFIRLLADRLAAASKRSAQPAGLDVRVMQLRAPAGGIAQNTVTGFPAPLSSPPRRRSSRPNTRYTRLPRCAHRTASSG